MLSSFPLVRATASLLGQPRLVHQVEQSVVLVRRSCRIEVQLDIDEQIVVLNLLMLEQTHVLLLLLVDLHVAVVPHDALVQFRSRQSIGGYQVQHVLVL